MPQHKKTALSSDKASLTLSADLQAAYPASSKKYLKTDDNLHVPFRYIVQSDTLTEQGRVKNPEIAVYDRKCNI